MNIAVARSIGHFDNEIALEDLEKLPDIKVGNISDANESCCLEDGHGAITLASGRPVDLAVWTVVYWVVGSRRGDDATLSRRVQGP